MLKNLRSTQSTNKERKKINKILNKTVKLTLVKFKGRKVMIIKKIKKLNK